MNLTPEDWRSIIYGCITGTSIGLVINIIRSRLRKKGGAK